MWSFVVLTLGFAPRLVECDVLEECVTVDTQQPSGQEADYLQIESMSQNKRVTLHVNTSGVIVRLE